LLQHLIDAGLQFREKTQWCRHSFDRIGCTIMKRARFCGA
jgi:hypothetical protein